MTTFPNVEVRELTTVDVMGEKTEHASLPCLACMFVGDLDRFKESSRATHLVQVSDLATLPMCRKHAEEYVGDKR